MPSLSDLPGSISRDKLMKALVRLGFIISKRGGKGDHYKATFEKTQKSITLPDSHLSKQVLSYILKEIEKYSGISWEDILKNF
jgi:predicted RNA binding protein YcfA (HicA-like mRNA interferase family)